MWLIWISTSQQVTSVSLNLNAGSCITGSITQSAVLKAMLLIFWDHECATSQLILANITSTASSAKCTLFLHMF